MHTLKELPRIGGSRALRLSGALPSASDVGGRGGVGAADWGSPLLIERRPADPFKPTLSG